MADVASKEERIKINLRLARRELPDARLAVSAEGNIGAWYITKFLTIAEYMPARDCWEWYIPARLNVRSTGWKVVKDDEIFGHTPVVAKGN